MKNIILAFTPGSAGSTTQTVYGPFDSFDAARDYGKDNLAESRWVILDLIEPTAEVNQAAAGDAVHA